jgi:hypothetical protein
MKKVKTHTVDGVNYKIEEFTEIDGLFYPNEKIISILRGNSLKALGSVLEEGLHAMGIPDRYLHKPKGSVKVGKSLSKVDNLAKLLWRLGWRRIED